MGLGTGVGPRTAVVTGAASPHGIGHATAQRYAEEGWAVVVLDMNGEGVTSAAETIAEDTCAQVAAYAVDVTNREQVFDTAKRIAASDLPPVGALANVAGIPSPVPFLEVTPHLWDRVIAVNLDVGTDNEELLNDPDYLGNRHARVRGERYDALVDEYLSVASELYPHALLHFEDFGASNARRILVNNRSKYRIFNDDMQGTGAIVISAVIAGMKTNGTTFADQRLLVYGAGTAGTGMADQIHAGMVRAGLAPAEAKDRIWLIDRAGLITDGMEGLPDYQAAYARSTSEVADWEHQGGAIGLLETVRRVHPTILIGTSTDHGAFTQEVIEGLIDGCERPIVLPLSNPTEKIEAMPQDIIAWSKGQALVATGIPILPFDYEGTTFHIGQGNNSLLYPGLGLGTIVSGAPHVTDAMILAAAEAVAGQVASHDLGASLLPPVDHLRASSATVAVAVVRQAIADGQCDMDPGDVVEAVRRAMWQPVYEDLEA